MTISQVNTSTFISDTIILLRTEVLNNISDPISAQRSNDEKFCVTSYAERHTKYPIVTVVDRGLTEWEQGGMQSTVSIQRFGIEIRVWARNVKERDELSQQILDRLRGRILTFSSTEKLHGFKIDGTTNVDEPGAAGVKSKIINISFMEILGEA